MVRCQCRIIDPFLDTTNSTYAFHFNGPIDQILMFQLDVKWISLWFSRKHARLVASLNPNLCIHTMANTLHTLDSTTCTFGIVVHFIVTIFNSKTLNELVNILHASITHCVIHSHYKRCVYLVST